MAGRTLFVRECPEDVHDYLECQAADARVSKAVALIAVIRQAKQLGLTVEVSASERSE